MVWGAVGAAAGCKIERRLQQYHYRIYIKKATVATAAFLFLPFLLFFLLRLSVYS